MEEAIRVINSDNHVTFAYGNESLDLAMALMARNGQGARVEKPFILAKQWLLPVEEKPEKK